MSAFFCLLNRKRVRRSTTSAAFRTCSDSRVGECACSEAPRAVLNWKHARRPFSCPTAVLKWFRTAARSFCSSVRSCLLMVMPCALANARISACWHFPVHSVICCSKAEQRACSERSRSQSSRTLSSSLSWKALQDADLSGCHHNAPQHLSLHDHFRRHVERQLHHVHLQVALTRLLKTFV